MRANFYKYSVLARIICVTFVLAPQLLVMVGCSDDPVSVDSDEVPNEIGMIVYEPPDHAGWEVQNGIHNTVTCLWGSDISNVFAAGDNGRILHYSGGVDWNPHFMLPGMHWRRLWGATPDTVYAFGGTNTRSPGNYDVGTVYRFSGGEWKQVAGYSRVTFYDAWGTAADDIWAVGSDNPDLFVTHFDGQVWNVVTDSLFTEANGSGRAVWGSAADDVTIATDSGGVLHFDGQTWESVDTPGDAMISLGGTSWDNIYGCTWAGEILHFDGTEWSVVASFDKPLTRIFVTDSGEIVVYGRGIILVGEESTWVEMTIGEARYRHEAEQFEAVWGPSTNHLLCAGVIPNLDYGTRTTFFMNWYGSEWRFMHPPAGAAIADMWGLNDHDIYAVGRQGTLLHYNGARWQPFMIPVSKGWPEVNDASMEDFQSVWASESGEIYVGSYQGFYHFDGSNWAAIDGFRDVSDLWGFASDDLYAIVRPSSSYDHQVVHFDGADWSVVGEFDNSEPTTLLGLDSGEIVITGSRGLCQVYDGSVWTDLGLEIDMDPWIISAWGRSLGDLFVAPIRERRVYHYDGSEWEEQTIEGASFTGRYFLGHSSDDLYLFSDRNVGVCHYDGEQWRQLTNEGGLGGGRGGWTGENTLFAGGWREIFHKSIDH